MIILLSLVIASTAPPEVAPPALPPSLELGATLPLEVTVRPNVAVETRWFVKPEGKDWDWDAAWIRDTHFSFVPARSGRYDLQVDVRRRGQAEPFAKKYLGSLIVAPRLELDPKKAVRSPPLPDRVDVGQTLDLSLIDSVPGVFEYQLATLHGSSEWKFSPDWLLSPIWVFTPSSPGFYDFHVNIRRRDTGEVVEARYLGQVRVDGALVKKVHYAPGSTLVEPGHTVRFFVETTGDQPIDAMEFRLVVNGWGTLQDWRPWPLAAQRLAPTPAWQDLQVEIRLRDDPEIMQAVWLNTFYVTKAEAPPANLVRALMADDFDAATDDPGTLALELRLAVRLMLWEALAVAPGDQLTRLEALPEVRVNGAATPPSSVELVMAGRSYVLNLTDHTLLQAGAGTDVLLALARYPDYRKLFDILAGLPEEEQWVVGVAYALHRGYRYGTPPQYRLQNVTDSIAHCGTLAGLLYEVLSRLHIDAQLMTISDVPHLLVDARGAGWRVSLDPSSGFAYPGGAEALGNNPALVPLRFPSQANLDFLQVGRLVPRGTRPVIGLFKAEITDMAPKALRPRADESASDRP